MRTGSHKNAARAPICCEVPPASLDQPGIRLVIFQYIHPSFNNWELKECQCWSLCRMTSSHSQPNERDREGSRQSSTAGRHDGAGHDGSPKRSLQPGWRSWKVLRGGDLPTLPLQYPHPYWQRSYWKAFQQGGLGPCPFY